MQQQIQPPWLFCFDGGLAAHVRFAEHGMALSYRTLFVCEPSIPAAVMIMAQLVFGDLAFISSVKMC